jgi:hypothetical protein
MGQDANGASKLRAVWDVFCPGGRATGFRVSTLGRAQGFSPGLISTRLRRFAERFPGELEW